MSPYACHIKVIVQDDQRFWLLSGYLNNSNEPDPTRPLREGRAGWRQAQRRAPPA
jgi:hypothetical protein